MNFNKNILKLSSFALLFFVVIIESCISDTGNKTIISGKLFSSNANKLYLNEINHFDYYNDTYILDSTEVTDDGTFKFKAHSLESKLVSVTTKKFKPYTYQVFSIAPEAYYYGNCEKFFTSEPNFYVSDEALININWYPTESVDSISNLDNSGLRQIKMRTFYLNAKKIQSSNLDYDGKPSIKENWEQLMLERDFDIKFLNLEEIEVENSFDNYIYSELCLGHLNTFLNWIESNYPEAVSIALKDSKTKNIYLNIFAEYNTHIWNSKSLEYYKFTERYVNHFLNLENGVFKHYHPPSELKRSTAKNVLNLETRKRYLELLDQQIENKND